MGFRKNREDTVSEIPVHLLRTNPYAPFVPTPAEVEAVKESNLVIEAVAHMDEVKLEAQESVVALDEAEASSEVVRAQQKPKNALVSLEIESQENASAQKKPSVKKNETNKASKAGKAK